MRKIEKRNCWFAHTIGQQGHSWTWGSSQGHKHLATVIIETFRNGLQKGKFFVCLFAFGFFNKLNFIPQMSAERESQNASSSTDSANTEEKKEEEKKN